MVLTKLLLAVLALVSLVERGTVMYSLLRKSMIVDEKANLKQVRGSSKMTKSSAKKK